MKHILIYTLLLLMIAPFAKAQQDPEAKEILDKLSAATKAHETIVADFKVTYTSTKDNASNSSEGTIKIKGEKYQMDFMGTVTYFNGKTIWSYLKEANEVNISDPMEDGTDLMGNPQSIFTIYEHDFKYKYLGTEIDRGETLWVVDLYPEDLSQQYARIRLYINKDDLYLSGAQVYGKEGSNFTISISNFKTDMPLPDNIFVFDEEEHPKAEIIDLRW
ncbi:MAG: LolA family protein [Bacteroidota bacterium]